MSLKARATIELDEWDYIKLKKYFCTANERIDRTKRQSMD
jgi:hypothetical protein